jgi:hypothetical protein
VIIAAHQGVTTAAQTDLATNLMTPVTNNVPPRPAASEPGHRSRMRRQVATPWGQGSGDAGPLTGHAGDT